MDRSTTKLYLKFWFFMEFHLFLEILFNMSEGGARLDLTCSSMDYQLAEAQEAFMRVARQHNWL